MRSSTQWIAAVFVLSLVAGGLSAQDIPVFSTAVEVVRVDVAALRDGGFVYGLEARDFEVRDNGVLQTVEIVSNGLDTLGGMSKPLDVVLALDVSDSVKGEPLLQLKTAAHAFVDLLRPEDSFSLLTFSSQIQLAVSPTDSRERAHEVIDKTQAQFTTSLYDAAFAAMVTTDANRGRPLVLVLSDGKDQGSWLKPEPVLRAAEGAELVVHAIRSRQTQVETTFLRELTTTTGGEEWRADYSELRGVLAKALEEFRSRYTLRYERKGVSRAGWHEFDIRVRRPGVKVRARTGYIEDDRAIGGPP